MLLIVSLRCRRNGRDQDRESGALNPRILVASRESTVSSASLKSPPEVFSFGKAMHGIPAALAALTPPTLSSMAI
jgi:hypothetical protein